MSRKWTYEIGYGYESILRDGVMVNKEQAVRALNNYESRIAELEAECASLGVRLHDEMSQLEIATDLGNKRWTALNEIYEKSEKHSAWWCKRKAQEGLGIK